MWWPKSTQLCKMYIHFSHLSPLSLALAFSHSNSPHLYLNYSINISSHFYNLPFYIFFADGTPYLHFSIYTNFHMCSTLTFLLFGNSIHPFIMSTTMVMHRNSESVSNLIIQCQQYNLKIQTLNFSNNCQWWASSQVLLGHLHVFFGEMSI